MPPQTAQSSFIPREAPQVGGSGRRSGLVDLFILLAVVLFVASIALAIGIFLYQQYLDSSIKSKVDQLQRAKAAFEPSLIQELTRLDDRMRSASDVLGAHITPSAFFHMLEATTISTISYQSLDFEAVDPQHMTAHMEGVAGSVNSIALQADLFSKGGMVSSPIFSNINRGADGVHFSLSAMLNPVAINYEQLIAGPAIQPTVQNNTQPSPFGGATQTQTPSAQNPANPAQNTPNPPAQNAAQPQSGTSATGAPPSGAQQ